MSRVKGKRGKQATAKDLKPSDRNGTANPVMFRISLEHCKKIIEVSEVFRPDCTVQPVIRLLIDLGYEEYKRKTRKAGGKESMKKSIQNMYWKKVLSGAKKRNSKSVLIPISRLKHLEDKS